MPDGALPPIQTSIRRSRAGSPIHCRARSGRISSITLRTVTRTSIPPAPEIWAQTGGTVSAFHIAPAALAARFAGISEFLKSKNPKVRCVLADPPGSSLYEYAKNGVLKGTGTGSITEGIGIARVTANFAAARIDDAVHVEDPETVSFVYRLLTKKVSSWAARAASTWPRPCVWRSSWAPAIPSSPSFAMGAPNTSPVCSTPSGLASKNPRAIRCGAPLIERRVTLEKALVA